MFIQPFVVSALALAATMCKPLCHPADRENYALVGQSGGERGVPLFCLYAGGAECFYGVKGGELMNGDDDKCPEESLGKCP
ncbi:hypothetical protein DFH09DRAFT_1125467, partial [Mycena vulgaris]